MSVYGLRILTTASKTYMREENLFPEALKKTIEMSESLGKAYMEQSEKERTRKRYEDLLKAQEKRKKGGQRSSKIL